MLRRDKGIGRERVADNSMAAFLSDLWLPRVTNPCIRSINKQLGLIE